MENDLISKRRFYGATKWTLVEEDVISLIQADMDLPVSPAILEAIQTRAEHPTFGYTDRGIEYQQAFADWLNRKHKYQVEANNIALSTGVMYSISAAIQLLSEPGDGVLYVEPTYPPFRDMVLKNGRECQVSDLVLKDSWTYDFLDLESKIKENTKILLLCNPHNPTGKVLNDEEVKEIARIAEKHNLYVVVDEIHADFVFDKPHLPLMNASEYMLNHTIACVSVSKTFNVAGLKVSACIIKNNELMERFRHYAATVGIHSINLFGLAVLKPALYESDAWLESVKNLIVENRNRVVSFIQEHKLPLSTSIEDGTYFMWIDFSKVNEPGLNKTMRDKARIAFSDGIDFGQSFENYQRLVLVSPPEIIQEFLERLLDFMKKSKLV